MLRQDSDQQVIVSSKDGYTIKAKVNQITKKLYDFIIFGKGFNSNYSYPNMFSAENALIAGKKQIQIKINLEKYEKGKLKHIMKQKN